MNKVILRGRLARDPEAQIFGEKKKVTFSVAVQRRGKNAADFFNCQCWDRSADFIELYFTKGKEILLEGQLRTDSYTNKEGKKVTITYVYVDNAEFCGPKAADTPKPEPKPAPAPKADDSEFLDVQMNLDDLDEMPFI